MLPIQTADSLQYNKPALITAIHTSPLSVKLLQMGCLPGKQITILRKAIGNNPIYVQVGTLYLALRAEEAAQIIVETEFDK